MIILSNGNKFRDLPTDPTELPGFKQDPTNSKILIQQFLPCKYRVNRVCATCPATGKRKTWMACNLLNITKFLDCSGCSKRQAI